jgi:hypothetical protein
MLDAVLDVFRGKAVTIPPMDGAFRPNMALDEAPALLEIPAPDNLVLDRDRVLFSSGAEILALPIAPAAMPAPVTRFGSSVTALAAAPDGGLAVGLEDGLVLIIGGAHEGKAFGPADFGGFACPTALAFAGPDTLLVAQGSRVHLPSDWVVDLMSKAPTGSVWRIDLAAEAKTCLARGLAFPYGLLPAPDGKRLIVSESWQHRLVAIDLEGSGPLLPVLTQLPGYPARLAPAADGGAWLCLFAPRNRLIEFVLQEDGYRADMIREIEREFWIAPALASGASFLEPLQCGGVKTMGIHKPWSPSRSYGLLVRLDRNLRPLASFHSRANGRRHGITSALAYDRRVLVAAKGGNAILGLEAM